MIHQARESDHQRIAGACRRRTNAPGGDIERLFDWRPDHELVAVGLPERPSDLIAPRGIDEDRVPTAGHEGAAHFSIGKDAAFDAARIEKHRVPGPILVPEIDLRRQERIRDVLAILADDVDEANTARARHRTGEMNVEPEEICRPAID